jgi:hypothetical protein
VNPHSFSAWDGNILSLTQQEVDRSQVLDGPSQPEKGRGVGSFKSFGAIDNLVKSICEAMVRISGPALLWVAKKRGKRCHVCRMCVF